MKVLFVAPSSATVSGGAIATRQTLRSLEPHCEIHHLVCDVPEPSRPRMYASAAWAALTGRSYWEVSWRNRELREKVARLHARESFDVIHCEWLQSAVPLRGLDLPLVIRALDVHFVDMERWAGDRRYWREQAKRFRHFEAETLNSARAAVALSREDEELLRECGVRNIVTIPPPRPVEAENGSSGEPLAVFVGRLDMAPNREAFFLFANEVWSLIRSRVRVVFAGGFPDAEVRRRAAECGIELIAPLSDAGAARLFADARIFLSPVRSGTGIKIKTLDAMAYGKPMIGFRGAFRGVPVEHGVHAMIAESPADFARQFDELIDDAPRRRAIGIAARELIRDRVDPVTLGARLRDVYARAR
jgi:glycosyltransferase involved in cell wall biosynthesis